MLFLKNIVLPLLAFLTVFVVCFLLLSAYFYNKRIITRKKIQHTLESFIVAVLIEQTDAHFYKSQLKHLQHTLPLHKNWCRKLAIATLIQYKKNITGQYASRIPKLFEDLGLHQYTLKRLKSSFINTKCEALYDIQMIGYTKKMKEILAPFLKHKRKTIRSSAYMTYFTLFPVVKDDFKNTSIVINDLNIIKIMDVMHQNRVKINPNAGSWLLSNNTSIQKIGIKILVFFNDKSHDNLIINLLTSTDSNLILEVIFALRDLFIFEGERPLLERLLSLSPPLQNQAFTTLKIIGSTSTTTFLHTHFDQLKSPELQFNAMDALYHVDKDAAKSIALQSNEKLSMYQHIDHLHCYGNLRH